MHNSAEKDERTESPLDPEAQYLEVIAASDELMHTYAGAPREHRAAILDIRAYLSLLEKVTAVSEPDLKKTFGCPHEVKDLPNCDLRDLHTSRTFLAFVTDVVLRVEDSVHSGAAPALKTLEFAARAFRQLRRSQPLVAAQEPDRLLVSGVTENLARGDLDTAWSIATKESDLLGNTKPLRTADGRLVFLSKDTISELTDLVLDGSFQDHLEKSLHEDDTD